MTYGYTASATCFPNNLRSNAQQSWEGRERCKTNASQLCIRGRAKCLPRLSESAEQLQSSGTRLASPQSPEAEGRGKGQGRPRELRGAVKRPWLECLMGRPKSECAARSRQCAESGRTPPNWRLRRREGFLRVNPRRQPQLKRMAGSQWGIYCTACPKAADGLQD
jgi:hypothetical protein